MKSDSIVIIPTYNEKENIEAIIRAVTSLEKAFAIFTISRLLDLAIARKAKKMRTKMIYGLCLRLSMSVSYSVITRK